MEPYIKLFILIIINRSIFICESKRTKLLLTIPDDYCETYCGGGICNDTVDPKTCDREAYDYIATNEYHLIMRDGHLEVKWKIPDPKIFNLSPISKENHLKLNELIVSDTSYQIRAVDYLRQLGVETVTRFENQLNSFKTIERNVHYINGPKSLKIIIQSNLYLNEIIEYINMITDNINEIIINAYKAVENQQLRLENLIFNGKSHLRSLTFIGFQIENVSTKPFDQCINLRKLVFTKCTVRNLTFVSTLQKSLEHLELDIDNEVDLKYFTNFPSLKLMKVRNYIPNENFTALVCTQNNCNFIRGINGLECPKPCQCLYIFDDLELNIDCSNMGLLQIPPLPIPIYGGVKLNFSNNCLSKLPTMTLPGYKSVTRLDVSRNMLTNLSINHLPAKLDYLDVSFNEIINMDNALMKYLKNVTIFKQSGNQWTIHCDDKPLLNFFRHLKLIIRMKSVEVRPMFLHSLTELPKGFLKFLGKHFIWLGVRKQEYYLINEEQLLHSMHRNLNNLTTIMSIYKNMEWLHQKLILVNQEYDLFYIREMAAPCPHKCECCYSRDSLILKIDCSNKFVYNFPDIVARNSLLMGKQNISSPIELHLSKNNISNITIAMLPKELRFLDLRFNNLVTLDDKVLSYLKKNSIETKLSGNPWNCGCKSRSVLSILRDHEPLEYIVTLKRCNISRTDCPDACVCCLDNLTWPSFIVDCRGEGLLQMPELSSRVTYVDLRNNNLTALSQKNRSYFEKRSLKLLLLDNPWSCTCNDIEKVNLMKSVSSSILDFTEIKCSNGEKLVSINEHVVCPSELVYYLALAISLVATIIALNFLIWFRQPVLVWFYEHGVCLSLAARRELDKDKRFDAFLAFTHKDEPLLEEFVDRLERGEPRFRLCFYLRDWLAGESIPDCIGQSIKDSRRIIVLMTENFMNSTWGRLEFRLALHATSRDRCKRLIVVLYPNVKNFDSLDSELRTYMAFNTYLERSHPNFWNKLIYSMPHTKLR